MGNVHAYLYKRSQVSKALTQTSDGKERNQGDSGSLHVRQAQSSVDKVSNSPAATVVSDTIHTTSRNRPIVCFCHDGDQVESNEVRRVRSYTFGNSKRNHELVTCRKRASSMRDGLQTTAQDEYGAARKVGFPMAHGHTTEVQFSECTASYIAEFDITCIHDKHKSFIVSSAVLSDSKMLFVDQNNKKLKLFDSNLDLVSVYTFQKSPKYVSVFDADEVVVLVGEDELQHFRVAQSLILKRTTDMSRLHLNTVSHIRRDLIAVAGDHFFCIYNVSGPYGYRTMESVSEPFSKPSSTLVDQSRNQVYLSDWNKNAAYAFDYESMKIVFRYTHEKLHKPTGLATDKDGNLYVCGHSSVFQVSPRGEHLQILLTRKDGLHHHLTIAFQPRGDLFIVGEAGHGHNKVKVFQMNEVCYSSQGCYVDTPTEMYSQN